MCVVQNIQFEESVGLIIARDHRYDGHAFLFLRDALDYTMKRVHDEKGRRGRHVSGKELLEGFRDHALEQYGPMAATLMEEWGVRECRDVGNMVFLLIEEQVFGRQDSDKLEDFEGHFDLNASLRRPFLPSGERRKRTVGFLGRK